MKRTALAAFMALAITMILASGAEAKPNYGPPDYGVCTGCHFADGDVQLTASDMGCTGSLASYALAVTTSHSWKEEYAVFNSAGSNIMNGSLPATISLAEGQTYTIFAVTNRQFQAGTDSVTVTPTCEPACTDGDGDKYFAEQGCGTVVDCNDKDFDINPGVEEVCGDGVDNNCGGGVDEGCVSCTDGDGDGYFVEAGCAGPSDCNDKDFDINPGVEEVCGDGVDNNCGGGVDEGCISEPAGDTTLDIIDEFGAVIASETAGECGKAAFYSIPAGTYFLELTKGETHFAKLRFIVPATKSPARVIVRAESEDEDDEASLKVKVDIYPMEDSEKLSVKKLGGSIEWDLQWAGSDEDFVVTIVGDGVVNLDHVTLETAYGSLNAYRIKVEDKRHRAEALFKKGDLISTLVPAGAEEGDRLRGRLSLVTPANEKVYRFRAKLED